MLKIKSDVFFFLFLIFYFLFLVSCLGRMSPVIFDFDDKIAKSRFGLIILSLENKDKRTLLSMFSKNALEKSNLIDENIDYLFNFFQGDVISWKLDIGPQVSTKYNYGNKEKIMSSFFSINTSDQKYLVYVVDYIEDTACSENIGLFTLRLIKEEDKETQFTSWQDMKIPGVYNPEVSNN